MTAQFRRQQRLQNEKKSRWKFVVALFLAVTTIGTSIFFILLYKPWKVECVTNLNTYCSDTTQLSLSVLQETPFWRAPQHYDQLAQDITQQHPNIAYVDFRRTWLGSIEVIVTEAKPLFPLRWNNQDYTARSNGSLTPNSAPSIPVVLVEEAVFTDDPPQIHYDPEALFLLSTLYNRLQNFTPSIQKIVIKNTNEIVLSPEGFGPIIMRLGTEEELEKQLSTLQAFFHSTTMDKQYQVLDIRFRDVIMK